jgi:hypothetical protein
MKLFYAILIALTLTACGGGGDAADPKLSCAGGDGGVGSGGTGVCQ